jgi:hypothetical protein
MSQTRPHLGAIDLAFWVTLSRVWSRWADSLAIVKPASTLRALWRLPPLRHTIVQNFART